MNRGGGYATAAAVPASAEACASTSHLDQIPDELKSRAQWVGFVIEGKKKIPCIADAPERKASSTDRRTWGPFSAAAEGVRGGSFDAVAYVLNADCIGVDLDRCFRASALTEHAAEIVRRCASYAETSISGTGVHVLLKGALPEGRGRRLRGLEIYDRKRFFITTGNRLPNSPAEIRPNPDAIAWMLSNGVTEKAETTETTEAISLPISAVSAISAVSVTSSADDIILKTLPKQAGERNNRLLDLARGLRFNAGMADRSFPELKLIVRRWHDLALPVIGTKEFAETWADFVHAWPKARLPLGDILGSAWREALTAPPPPIAADYDLEPVCRLVCLCAALARLSPDKRFFLSSHAAGKLLRVSPPLVHRWLQMLDADGVVKILERGNEHRAARYRWTAPTEQVADRIQT